MRPSLVPDVLPAVAVGAISVVGTSVASRYQGGVRALDAAGYLLLLAAAGALVLRRRWPAQVLLLVLAATMTYAVFDYPIGPVFLPLILALFTAVIAGHRLIGYAALIAGFAGFTTLTDAARGPGGGTRGAIGLAAWLLALLAVSEVVRYRRALAQAGRQRRVELARAREQEARRRASEERLEIARELHDVLAHSISLINVQASVALELMDQQPEQARGALGAIKAASRDALVEVQSVLQSLRATADEPAPRRPAPSLLALDDLVSRSRAARRCRRVPAASWSSTANRQTCSAASGRWPRGTPCCRPASPGG